MLTKVSTRIKKYELSSATQLYLVLTIMPLSLIILTNDHSLEALNNTPHPSSKYKPLNSKYKPLSLIGHQCQKTFVTSSILSEKMVLEIEALLEGKTC